MVKSWMLSLLLLAGCGHRPYAPVPASAPAEPAYAPPPPAAPPPASYGVAGPVTLPHGWWSRPGIVDAPLAQLIRVNVRGQPWRAAAQRLGFPNAGFSTDRGGQFDVMAHEEGAGQDFAIYLDDGAQTTYGVIVRGKTALPAGSLATVIEAARRADHGAQWGLYTYDDYTVLASEARPLTEIGCSGSDGSLVCYAAVYGNEIDPRNFTTVKGNTTAVFQRRVQVK